MRHDLLDLLERRPWLLADGATGTNYFQMGLASGGAPELWNVEHPERVRALHGAFIAAGADIVLTNSFGGSRRRLMLHAAQARVGELNRRAAELARAEADAANRPVIVAGSVGPTGDLFEPLGEFTHAEGVAVFAEQMLALEEGGADVVWLETVSSVEELNAAAEASLKTGLPLVTTMSFDTNGRTMMGITPPAYGKIATDLPRRPIAIGANCGTGASELVATVLKITEARPDCVVVAKGNCGMPTLVDGQVHYSGTPELMADYARLALDAGARIIGGCCGTTPDHLKAMHQALLTHVQGPRPTVEAIEARLGPVSALAKGHDAAAAAKQRRQQRQCA